MTIAGLPGTGKSTFAKYLADMFRHYPGYSILIYDPLDQYRAFSDEERYIPEADSQTEFDATCRRLCAVSNVVFIVDEAEAYLREGYLSNTYAFKLVKRGRNWGVGIYAVTRRLQDLSKGFFELCQHCFFFNCHPRVKDYLKKQLEPEAISAIMSLAKYDFVHYNMETHEWSVSGLELPARNPEALARAKVEAEMMSKAHLHQVTKG